MACNGCSALMDDEVVNKVALPHPRFRFFPFLIFIFYEEEMIVI